LIEDTTSWGKSWVDEVTKVGDKVEDVTKVVDCFEDSTKECQEFNRLD
jgi:hypothetical protein